MGLGPFWPRTELTSLPFLFFFGCCLSPVGLLRGGGVGFLVLGEPSTLAPARRLPGPDFLPPFFALVAALVVVCFPAFLAFAAILSCATLSFQRQEDRGALENMFPARPWLRSMIFHIPAASWQVKAGSGGKPEI